jgi:hypothetical protein
MLARREIETGKCYVNNSSRQLREVLKITREQKVIYNAYDMLTGILLRTPNQRCHRSQLIRWADREASPAECSNLNRVEAAKIFEMDQMDTPSDRATREVVIAESLTTARNQSPVGYWCRLR